MAASMSLAALTRDAFLAVDAGEKASLSGLSVGLRAGCSWAQADGADSAHVSRHGCLRGDGRFVMRPAPEVARATSASGHGGRSLRCASGHRSMGMVRAG